MIGHVAAAAPKYELRHHLSDNQKCRHEDVGKPDRSCKCEADGSARDRSASTLARMSLGELIRLSCNQREKVSRGPKTSKLDGRARGLPYLMYRRSHLRLDRIALGPTPSHLCTRRCQKPEPGYQDQYSQGERGFKNETAAQSRDCSVVTLAL